jgi:hypothetical protein
MQKLEKLVRSQGILWPVLLGEVGLEDYELGTFGWDMEG